MALEILNKQKRIKIERKILKKILDKVIKEAKCEKYEISLLLLSDRKIKILNSQWRGINSPTDCLSFPLGEKNILGDIIISVERAKKQAIHHDIYGEIAILFTHSLLHLLGYDHEKKEDRRKMSKMEEKILKKIGIIQQYH